MSDTGTARIGINVERQSPKNINTSIATKMNDGKFRNLRGDEIGITLGYYLAKRNLDPKAILANSIVSSSALGKIAVRYNVGFKETLTGFKYLAKVKNMLFGYEEALGYAVDAEHVNDKDGISASLILAKIASELKETGKTFEDYLDQIWDEIGYHRTSSNSLRFESSAVIPPLVEKLRNSPPKNFGPYQVTALEDLAKPTGDLPPTNGLRFYLDNQGNPKGIRVIIRPSGTEPKLKVYLEVIGKDSNSKVQCEKIAQELEAEFTKLKG